MLKVMKELVKTKRPTPGKPNAEEEFVRKMTALALEGMENLTPRERKARLDAFDASANAVIASARAKRRQR